MNPPRANRPPSGEHHRESGTDWLHRQMFDRRIVQAHGRLDHDQGTRLCAELLTLDALGDDPVQLLLRTPDGEVAAALAVMDVLDQMSVPVHAIALGEVGGPAIAVLAAATRRIAAPHATLRLGEPHLDLNGTAGQVAAQAEQHRSLLEALYVRVAEVSGTPLATVHADMRAGRVLNAAEALEYGLVQEISVPPPHKLV